MIKTYAELINENKSFSNPKTKIERDVRNGRIFKIVPGYYETDKDVDPLGIIEAINSPSYVSFEYAFYIYDMIPERCNKITCASLNNKKNKIYKTQFGEFYFSDIPQDVYYLEINRVQVDKTHAYNIASREKALCDFLYKQSFLGSVKNLRIFLLENMRMEEDMLALLNIEKIESMWTKYRSRNVKLLLRYLEGIKNDK